MKYLLQRLCISILISLFVVMPRAHADSAKDFVVSCTYGALAGTLVGTATLAFTDKPGDNLDRIARGASIGLYAGILLGLYVINLNSGPSAPEDESASAVNLPRLQVLPLITLKHGIEGGSLSYDLARF